MKVAKLTPKPKPPVQDMNAVYRTIGERPAAIQKSKEVKNG